MTTKMTMPFNTWDSTNPPLSTRLPRSCCR